MLILASRLHDETLLAFLERLEQLASRRVCDIVPPAQHIEFTDEELQMVIRKADDVISKRKRRIITKALKNAFFH